MSFNIPRKLFDVIESIARIIVLYGGRGGGKTESVSEIVVGRMLRKKINVLCLREFANSIDDSVHSVLSRKITDHNYDDYFTVLDRSIQAFNGSVVMYGQLARNVSSIKSKDNIDLCWVEEAETVKEESIDILEPSIRAAGSQIIYTLNPKSAEGAIYKKYIAPNLERIKANNGVYFDPADGGLLVININIADNPFVNQELINDSNRLKRTDYKKWLHVYGGELLLEDGDDNLIKSEETLAASKASVKIEDQNAALIIGVDPARFGKDATSIIRRRGRGSYKLERYYKQDTMATAGRVVAIINAEKPDRVFIDVGGLGAGVYDRLVELGYGDVVTSVNFGSGAINDSLYVNKRTEIWDLMAQWIKDQPAMIPDDTSLITDLITPKYAYKSNGKMMLESKDDMKKRLGRSPDSGDALALTFSFPVRVMSELQRYQMQSKPKEYDPYA